MSFPIREPDVSGRFVRRINRFLGVVEIEGKTEYLHIHDPGRLPELLTPGVVVWARHKTGGRASYYLTAVELEGELVLVDSALHNKIAKWLVESGHVLRSYTIVKSEPTFGGGRFDLLVKNPAGKLAFVEVKGVTLQRGLYALFPDAPTARGRRHVEKLVELAKSGSEAWIIFLVFRKHAEVFSPNWETDWEFSRALVDAYNNGVGIAVVKLEMYKWGLKYVKTLPLEFNGYRNL